LFKPKIVSLYLPVIGSITLPVLGSIHSPLSFNTGALSPADGLVSIVPSLIALL
jgi:hypothetical protein